ncbi:MAG: PAS domain-containing protein, partial [Bdellovibrionales bacterium]
MKTFLPHLYEAVANEAMFGIVVFDPRGHCLFSNKMAIQLLGAERPRLEDLIPGESYPQIKSFSREFLKHDGLYQDIMIKNAEGGKFIANIGVRYLVVDHHMA